METRVHVGGQAVLEGVMMRDRTGWAVAVRKPEGDIAVENHELPGHSVKHPWLKWVFVRGVYTMYESLAVGFRALKISARYALGEEDETADKAFGKGIWLALPFVLAILVLTPALVSKLAGSRIGATSDLTQNLLEGGIRIALFVGYILAISFIPDIRRTFQYHGAEHKTIHAFEKGDPLVPDEIDRYSTIHIRCGTNFLFILLFITIVGHLVADLALAGQPIAYKIAARILMIPVLAGGSYEVIRAAGKYSDSWLFKAVSLPGLAMQKITTRAPSHDQIEVAIEAIKALDGVRAPE